jgi:eukaryotic-like serine/threonine-protein kinase
MDATGDGDVTVMPLAEEFLERCRRGERPTIGEYCRQHPAHATEIREVFEALLMVEEFKPGSSNQSESARGVTLDGDRQPQERIGGYRILREIGRGGMGIVYEAEQEALGRRVALKVLPGALAGDAKARARFDREARAAARMHHTNIVPVFDVGQDEWSLFYAMQMICGAGLDRVIGDLKRLRDQGEPRPGPGDGAAGEEAGFDRETSGAEGPTSACAVLSARSELSAVLSNRRAYYRSVARIGIQIASALSYAHARGVVHRDIKPSNLLLDSAGVVWVTDFGLAKAGDDGVTQTGDLPGTIRYMSPERFRGECDARADVYSLGLTLYELLALEPAFAATDRMTLIEQIRQVEARSLRSRDPRLPRDLETIVLKAMEKDPRRRYQSAREMGDDLERFAAGQPIHTRRIGVGERLVRWAGRNKLVAGLTAAVFMAMAVGTSVSMMQAVRARRAEDAALNAARAEKDARLAAEAREAETRAVLEFVEKRVLAAARPQGQSGGLGRAVSLRETLESSLPHIARSFRGQPLVEAHLRRTLGVSFLRLGELRFAKEQLEAARALDTEFRAPDDPDTLATLTDLANSYAALGRHTEAVKLREQTLTLVRAKLGPDHPETLTSMSNLAASYFDLGRHADALKLSEQTLALRQVKLGPDHPETLASINNVAGVYQALGRHAEALKLHRQTLARRKTQLGPDHPDTLTSMSNLASAYQALGRHAEALKLNEQTLALREAELGPDHPDTLCSMSNLANSNTAMGRHAEAVKLNEKTLARRKAHLGVDHPDTLASMINLSSSYAALGRYDLALPLGEDSVARAKTQLGLVHPSTLASMTNLAHRYTELGRHAEARKLQEETLARWKATRGLAHPDTLTCMIDLANTSLVLGQPGEAVRLCEQVLAQRKAQLGPDHPETLTSMSRFATSYAAASRYCDAIALFEETLARQKAQLGGDHPDTLCSTLGLAATLSALGRHAEALRHNERILAIRKAKLGPDHVDTLLSQMSVASGLLQVGRGAEAVAMAREAAERWEKHKGTDAVSSYNAARCRALAAAAIRATNRSAQEGTKAADAEADQAVARLRQAVSAGWSNAAFVAADHNFDTLRDRDDFRELASRLGGATPR